jgi:hypothetical protein
MKTVYDMSSGQVVETTAVADDAQRLAIDATAQQELQLRLQPVTEESLPEKGLPPELVLADLNAFLDKMR